MPVNRFYAETRLGPNRSRTPEGFLICRSVPIARTGTLLYAAGEVPIDPDRDGIIGIGREPEDVFSPDAVASFEGKPVTNDHPPLGVKVDPSNWRQLAIGHVENVRRGDGALLDDQYLYADMIIKDAKAIQDVLDGKREVSAGYDAEYEQLEPGRGRQHDIVGNHVALVDRGRCGPHCSIGDSETMPAKRGSVWDRIMQRHRVGDEQGLVMELDKVKDMLGEVVSDDMPSELGGSSGHAINLNFHGMTSGATAPKSTMPSRDEGEEVPPGTVAGAKPAVQPAAEGAETQMPPWFAPFAQRMETMEQAIMLLAQDESDEGDGEVEMPDGGDGEDAPGRVEDDAAEIEGNQKKWPHDEPGTVVGDRRRAAVGDSTSLASAYQDMLSRAAVLCPGVRLPTFDAARGARMTIDAMCNYRRATLAKAWGTEDGREAIGSIYQRRKADFSRDAMTCDAATTLFNGASELMRRSNTQDGQRRMAAVMDHGRELAGPSSRVPTPAELNAKAREFYKVGA